LAVDSEKLDLEIAALRLVFLNDRDFRPPGQRQAATLASLMNSGLSDRRRALRLEALKEITGLPQLESSTQLTAHMVSTLIGYLKQEDGWGLNDTGMEFLQALEARCVDRLPAKKERRKHNPDEESVQVFPGQQTTKDNCHLSSTRTHFL
jgi:hypothetical protein